MEAFSVACSSRSWTAVGRVPTRRLRGACGRALSMGARFARLEQDHATFQRAGADAAELDGHDAAATARGAPRGFEGAAGRGCEIAGAPQKPHATSYGVRADAADLAGHGAAGIAGATPAGLGGAVGGGCEIAGVSQKPHATSYGAGADNVPRCRRECGEAGPARMRNRQNVAKPLWNAARWRSRRGEAGRRSPCSLHGSSGAGRAPWDRASPRAPRAPRWAWRSSDSSRIGVSWGGWSVWVLAPHPDRCATRPLPRRAGEVKQR